MNDELFRAYIEAVESGEQVRVTMARARVIHEIAEAMRSGAPWDEIRAWLDPFLAAAMNRPGINEPNHERHGLANFELGQLDGLATLLADGMPREGDPDAA